MPNDPHRSAARRLRASKTGGVMEDDSRWLEPDDLMGVWEHQGQPLTVSALRLAVEEVESNALIVIDYYDGSGNVKTVKPMHIDLRGTEGSVNSVVITVVD